MFERVTMAASLVPIFAAIYFTCRGFIGLGMTTELVIILTTLFAALSWLNSQALLRVIAVKNNKAMASAVILLGAAFLITETFFAHLGLEWLLGQGTGIEAPASVIWFFSGALSITNVLAKWAFLGSATSASYQSPQTSPKNVFPIDPKIEKKMAKIGDQVRRAS